MQLRVAGLVSESVVDGPGFRYVVFAQGCAFGCEGCHNPKAQDFEGGTLMDVQEILEKIKQTKLISGVTFSGGEPFLQAEAFYELGTQIKALGRDIIIFTGYTWEELMELSKNTPYVLKLLELCRLVVDGRFVLSLRDLSLAFRGSSNQRIISVQESLRSGEIVLWQG